MFFNQGCDELDDGQAQEEERGKEQEGDKNKYGPEHFLESILSPGARAWPLRSFLTGPMPVDSRGDQPADRDGDQEEQTGDKEDKFQDPEGTVHMAFTPDRRGRR